MYLSSREDVYFSLLVDASSVFRNLTKFHDTLDVIDYLGFYPDTDNNKIVVFFDDPDEQMRGYKIVGKKFLVQIGHQYNKDDVDEKYLWRKKKC